MAPNGRTTKPVQKMPRLNRKLLRMSPGKKCVANTGASTP
jgi:hypothetical protein